MMLDELVRERDAARAEVARLRAAIEGAMIIARPRVGAPASEDDPDLANPPCYGVIALGCERARQEAIAEALELG